METKFSKEGLTRRLNFLCEQHFEGRWANLHRASGVPQANLSGYKEGKEPNLDALTRIARACKVTTDWLLTGEGPMTKEEESALELQTKATAHVQRYDVKAAAGAGCISDYAAEDGLMAFDEEWLVREMGLVPSKAAVIKVFGDSMDPVLSDGDFVLIDCRESDGFAQDAIYVFNLDGKIYVKRIQRSGRQIKILSDNPKYEPWVPDAAELESMRIIGRVVLAGRWM
ncbi:MAG: helix-turn-helix transcriptional regulator [Magnetococcales bacterium]|nr:helix-turn-helix transcriptional regulator [Magnetococcales bacterium]